MIIHNLQKIPPGIAFDGLDDPIDALRLSKGLPLPAQKFSTRPELLHRYLLALWYILVSPTVFTTRFFHGLVGLLATALAYRAGKLLTGSQLGALVTAGALAASMPNLFLSRAGYRAGLLPPTILAACVYILYARRSSKNIHWFLAGIFSGGIMHIYTAGVVAPAWIGGLLFHQHAIAPRRERPRRQASLWLIAGFAPLFVAWAFVITHITNFFWRVTAVSGPSERSLVERFVEGMPKAITAYYHDAYAFLLVYNVPDTPFLNPALFTLAVVGFVTALWWWRHTEGALVLGGLFLFMLPGALSVLPTHPLRLIGTIPFLALLAGWGAASGLKLLVRWGCAINRAKLVHATLSAGLVLVVVFSIARTHARYQRFFAGPEKSTHPERYYPPSHFSQIPADFSLAFVEAMETLLAADQPSYVPLTVIDNTTGVFMLTGTHFSNVVTWPRSGLQELPAGQVFYPAYDKYHDPTPQEDPLQVLLLPDEGTIVILPPAVGPIRKEIPGQTVTITSAHWDWEIAYVTPRDASALPPISESASPMPIMGDLFRPVGQAYRTVIQPGETVDVLVEWEITGQTNHDVWTSLVLMDDNHTVYGLDTHQPSEHLFPSPLWREGDIVPVHYTINLPEYLPSEAYHWIVGGWVSLPQETPLTINGTDEPLIYWGVARRSPQVGVPIPENIATLDARLGDFARIEGYTFNQHDNTIQLVLYWRALRTTSEDYTSFVHVMAGDNIVGQQDNRLSPPTWSWFANELIISTYTLQLPPDASPDAIYAGMYSFPSLKRLTVIQNGRPTADDRVFVTAITQ